MSNPFPNPFGFKTRVITSNKLFSKCSSGEEWVMLFEYKDKTLNFTLAGVSGSPDPLKALTDYSQMLYPKSLTMSNPEKTLKLFKNMLEMEGKTDAMKTAERELFFMLIHRGLITLGEHQIYIVKREEEPPAKSEPVGECCICLEEKPISWKCKVCKDGIICRGCRKGAKKSCEGCPVCRSV